MPTPVINYAGQPWTAGATWQLNNAGNFGTQEVTDFTNGSAVTLYTGDVVVLGTVATTPDPTGFNVNTIASASSPLVVGVVGGMTNQPSAGGLIPYQTTPFRYDACGTTASSATVTDTTCLASDLGKEVIGTGIPSGAYIISVTAGTSFVLNVNATATGTPTLAIGPREGQVGPGWTAYPVGQILPVVMSGWAYVNIGGNTVAAGGLLATSATARVAAAVASGAALLGTFIGVALEAQTAGIPSGDGTANKLIRCWVTKF